MIAEQYRNIKPHFAGGKISPVSFRWRCILLDQDTENPPFEPARYFVVNVFAETRDQVIDCLGEEYPWCYIMVADRAIGLNSDDEFLESWLEYYDNTEQVPLREAPHGKENTNKTFHVRERADVIFEYIVEAIDEQDACDQVYHGTAKHHRISFIEHEVLGAEKLSDDNNQ